MVISTSFARHRLHQNKSSQQCLLMPWFLTTPCHQQTLQIVQTSQCLPQADYHHSGLWVSWVCIIWHVLYENESLVVMGIIPCHQTKLPLKTESTELLGIILSGCTEHWSPYYSHGSKFRVRGNWVPILPNWDINKDINPNIYITLSFQVQSVSHTTLLCPQCVLQLQVPPACTPPCQQPVEVDPSHHWCCHHWPPPPPRWPPVMGRSSRQTSLPYGLTPWLGNMGLRSAGREGCRALSCWGRADLAPSSR